MKCVNFVLVLIVGFLAKGEAACNPSASGVSQAEKTSIVNEHNKIREQVARGELPGQPKASNMKRMKWDETLAKAAQKIAETCIFAHVKVNDPRFSVGQNLYWSASTINNKTANWPDAITAFFNEHKTYHYGTTTYNHYTQLVWANSYLVGCGYTYYQKKRNWYEKLYVCNYGPAGNYIGETPYKIGSGCENLCSS